MSAHGGDWRLMATPRREVYLWVTWLTKILAGDQSCEWSTWFKAHFQDFEKRPRDNDIVAWTARHGEMVRKRAEELRRDGYEVFVEDQNKFTLKGRAATLQGKPDIVAVKEDDFLVVDCKSGKQRDSDRFQVLIYMMILPLTHPACQGKIVRGELEYPDGPVLIDALPNKVRELIKTTIERVGGPTPLPIVPSTSECRLCDLTKADCQQRIEAPERAAVTTNLW